MEKKSSKTYSYIILQLIIAATIINAVPLHKQKKKTENARTRGYIEIDGSDPFNIPKHSKYVKGPTPDFDAMKDVTDDAPAGAQVTQEHKEPSSAKEIENVDTDENPDIAVDAQKDVEREKAMDKVYDAPKEENGPKEEEENQKENNSNSSKDESEEERAASIPLVSQENQLPSLASRDRLDSPDPSKPIQDIEQIFQSTHRKQSNIMSPNNDPFK